MYKGINYKCKLFYAFTFPDTDIKIYCWHSVFPMRTTKMSFKTYTSIIFMHLAIQKET